MHCCYASYFIIVNNQYYGRCVLNTINILLFILLLTIFACYLLCNKDNNAMLAVKMLNLSTQDEKMSMRKGLPNKGIRVCVATNLNFYSSFNSTHRV